MPRKITRWDVEQQDLRDYPITVDQRLEVWDRTEGLHLASPREAPAGGPGVLEIILQGPGQHGMALAADRLRNPYMAGLPVISDAGLLYGHRFHTRELPQWHRHVAPNGAVLLSDAAFSVIFKPRFPFVPWRHQDVFPTREQWDLVITDLKDQVQRLVFQGHLVVLVLSPHTLHPDWLSLFDCPKVHVYMDHHVGKDSSRRDAFSLGHYIARKANVVYHDDAMPYESISPLAYSYEDVTEDRLREALHLVALFDQRPEGS